MNPGKGDSEFGNHKIVLKFFGEKNTIMNQFYSFCSIL